MYDVPDAPWIRDAEINGMPEGDDVYCPVCGEENPETFYVQEGDVVGCDCCCKKIDPWDWMQGKRDE